MVLFKKIRKGEREGIKESDQQRHKAKKCGRLEERENMPTGRQNISQMKRKSTLYRTSCIFYIIIYIIKIF